ncbi:MAG: bacteriohemerythrin [Treponema sp.]|nr:bacteriohemerythrin [Treponema sp.]
MPTNKNIITWQHSYSVKVNLIDQQHMHLINLTNKLFHSCLEGKDSAKDAFRDAIRDAVDYVGYHFSTEEKLMERVAYPDLKQHKQEHVDFVREVYNQLEEFKSKKISAPLTFVYFLKDWTLYHIAVSDRKMGEYFLKLQRAGELQKISLNVKTDGSNRVHIR